MSRTEEGSRPADRAAAAMRARTSVSRSAIMSRSPGLKAQHYYGSCLTNP